MCLLIRNAKYGFKTGNFIRLSTIVVTFLRLPNIKRMLMVYLGQKKKKKKRAWSNLK